MGKRDLLYWLLIVAILLLLCNRKNTTAEKEYLQIDSLKIQNKELIMQIDSMSNVIGYQSKLIDSLKSDIEVNLSELVELKEKRNEIVDIVSKLSIDESIRILSEFLSDKNGLQ